MYSVLMAGYCVFTNSENHNVQFFLWSAVKDENPETTFIRSFVKAGIIQIKGVARWKNNILNKNILLKFKVFSSQV